MTETGKEKDPGQGLGKIALYLFLTAAGTAIFSLVLGFLDTANIISLPLAAYYVLGAAVGKLLGLAVDIAVLALIVKAITMLRDKWKTHNKKQQ
ncbi:MAG: hypothetical protein JHC26_06205 [Thermofilum sp.]|jgi:hypothetical protein|uniref:hypothetical protein n=1 Tax=Thermofilum sp. TaxID=1961369 RepID=UPI00258D6569|nr:hypothetical protein [Thermofilum sp.]MCI4408664.1 hypothetical protein [Thermofilum sp.]